MIPKIIFQTWKTKDLHPNIVKIRTRIQELNPTYKMMLFDDDDMERFIYDNFSDTVYSAYKRLVVGAAKADFWRYCVLYLVGGIYLDIDSEIVRPLDELIQECDQCIITREKHTGNFNNWFMIFEPNHPILKKAIEMCCWNIENYSSADTAINVAQLTGPAGPFTCAINETLVPLYKESVHLWYETDAELNDVFNTETSPMRVRFYGYDMESFGIWKHEYAEDLYAEQPHWTKESILLREG